MKKFVCIKEQTDGFGSQFQTIIASILYAGINKYEYIHRAIRKMEHNYDNETDQTKLMRFYYHWDNASRL
ncbi:MAG: hypothetical protein IH795_06790 [Bacteroidetes bacterium]|nr:hypothetical protein [Bacteroidota bacterium]